MSESVSACVCVVYAHKREKVTLGWSERRGGSLRGGEGLCTRFSGHAPERVSCVVAVEGSVVLHLFFITWAIWRQCDVLLLQSVREYHYNIIIWWRYQNSNYSCIVGLKNTSNESFVHTVWPINITFYNWTLSAPNTVLINTGTLANFISYIAFSCSCGLVNRCDPAIPI